MNLAALALKYAKNGILGRRTDDIKFAGTMLFVASFPEV